MPHRCPIFFVQTAFGLLQSALSSLHEYWSAHGPLFPTPESLDHRETHLSPESTPVGFAPSRKRRARFGFARPGLPFERRVPAAPALAAAPGNSLSRKRPDPWP